VINLLDPHQAIDSDGMSMRQYRHAMKRFSATQCAVKTGIYHDAIM